MTAQAQIIPNTPTSPVSAGQGAPRSLKIAQYLRVLDLAEGGVVRCVLDLSAALAQAGHSITLFTCDAKDAPSDWTADNAATPTVVELEGPGSASAKFPTAMLPEIEKHLAGHDALHLHALWQRANPQWANAANTLKMPYVLSTHGMLDVWPMSQSPIKKRLYHALIGKKLLAGAARIHCTARGELDQACKWFPRSHGHVVPLVFDLEPFDPGPGPSLARRTIPGFDRGYPTVLFISRLHVKKGVEHLIRAASELKARGINATFLVAGTGDEHYTNSLYAMTKALGVSDSVRFLGMVSGQSKFSLLQAADISLLPTSQENFGFSVVEAMAAGSPIITTKGVDIWPELEKSGGAILTEQHHRPIADAIETLVNNPVKRHAMGDAAKRWAFDTFAGDSIVKKYEALYLTAPAGARS